MQNLLDFFQKNYLGLIVMFLTAIGIIFIIDRLAWIFAIGRYKTLRALPKSGFMYILSDFFVKIITDFRHFLALVLVVIFAVALIYACSISNGNIDNLSKALQAVVSTLGGLVGSIVGYYFGESAAKSKNLSQSENPRQIGPPVQGDNVPVEPIEPVEEPEGLNIN